jgi:mono/diheme cytochrome c family protein
MSDQLAAAAAAMNVPEVLVQRSAEARAKASGGSAEDIIAAWAGGGSAPAPSAPEPGAAEPAAPEPAATPAEPEPAAETPAQPALAAAPTPAPAATASAPTPPPAPDKVTPEEALSVPVVVSVPTAGLKERTSSALPRWMAVALMIVPLFGLLYLTSNIQSAGCVDGGFELAVDRVTGFGENCDGSAFEGRAGAGGAGAEFIAQGRELYTSVGCAGCHGANGEGGQGPAFANVLVTFGSCPDHVEWVRLGSSGFQAAGMSTYGDVAKPIAGGMPGHASLSQEQLASVVSFERVVFGGGAADQVLADCGLIDAAPSEDGATTDTTVGGEASAG